MCITSDQEGMEGMLGGHVLGFSTKGEAHASSWKAFKIRSISASCTVSCCMKRGKGANLPC